MVKVKIYQGVIKSYLYFLQTYLHCHCLVDTAEWNIKILIWLSVSKVSMEKL